MHSYVQERYIERQSGFEHMARYSSKLAKKQRRRSMPQKNWRLIRLREKYYPLSARSAALGMGINYQRYIKYEQGLRALTKDAAEQIAPFLHTTPGHLLYGDEEKLMPSTDLSLFLSTDVAYFIKIAEGHYPASRKKIMLTNIKLPFRAYAVEQPDRSMMPTEAAQIGKWPVIQAGVQVLVDPDGEAQPDEVVHAVLPRLKLAVTRVMHRFRDRDGKTRTRLVPLNPAFEEIIMDEAHGDRIVGVYLGQIQLPGLPD